MRCTIIIYYYYYSVNVSGNLLYFLCKYMVEFLYIKSLNLIISVYLDTYNLYISLQLVDFPCGVFIILFERFSTLILDSILFSVRISYNSFKKFLQIEHIFDL